MKKIYILILLLIGSFGSYSQSKADSTFHIYLLIGQSNMAGRGQIAGRYLSQGNPNVLMLDKNNQWVPAKHPLHFDKPKVAGVGPGLAFAIKMARANPGVKIGLVPCAVGGSPIDVWKPGGYDADTKTHPYDDALKRVALAMQRGVFKGILWHQGESDSTPENAAEYLSKLTTLIGQLRDSIRNQNLPFVAAELGRYNDHYAAINQTIAQLSAKVPFTAVVSSKNLKHKGDSTHFNSSSAQKLGKRFARKMKSLQRKIE